MITQNQKPTIVSLINGVFSVMIKKYKIFKSFFFAFIAAFSVIAIMGTVAFSISYNKESHTLDLSSPLTFIFLFLIVAVFAAIIVLSFMLRNIHFERIKKHTRLTSFCASMAAIMLFCSFVNDILNLTVLDMDYTAVNIVKIILCPFVCAYFVIEALPRFINRKWVEIPVYVKFTLSLICIAWAILGIFTVYFTSNVYLLSTGVMFNAKILTYVAMALFFVFEAEREFSRAKYGLIVASALTTSLLSFAFSASSILCIMLETMDMNSIGFTMFNHLATVGIGLFSLSRVYSILKTMKLHIINGK